MHHLHLLSPHFFFHFFFFFFNDTATTEIYTLSLTTLFRSACARGARDGAPRVGVRGVAHAGAADPRSGDGRPDPAERGLPREMGQGARSEEHTSELQSPCNLVCRLLLEKKKKNKSTSARMQQQRKSAR